MQATITLQREAVPLVRASLDMKRNTLEFNLRQYQARLAALEKRHRMTSEQFAARFGAGELGDDDEWFEWEFTLDVCTEIARQLELLKSIQL